MSDDQYAAQYDEQSDGVNDDQSDDPNDTATTGAPAAPAAVEVRRNLPLSAGVGGFAALLTAAFAVRAFTGGTLLDWVLLAVLAAITAVHAAAVVDSRAPLLVADDQGVRLREGGRWRGISWPEIDCLEHLPRRRPLRDGHLLVVGHDDQQLIVPLTLATTVVGATRAGLSDALAALADGRADVVEVVPGLAEPEADTADETDVTDVTDDTDDADDADDTAGPTGPDDTDTGKIARVEVAVLEPEPARPTVHPARVEVHRPAPVQDSIGANALRLDPSPEEVTVVLDDVAVRPAETPVIGPQLAVARERLRLTVDQLSDRTRVRPHVIEAIEVDDFGPCGGDFYARGHLRTLARVLGVEAGPLVAAYDETYADAPVDPRRVFESELATGVGGSIRGTRGGRNWSVLIAAVMGAVLVWSVAKLVMDGPVAAPVPPVLNQSGGLPKAGAGRADPVKVKLTAPGGGAQVVLRDAAGDIVFDGNLAFGQETADLEVVPPVRIWTSDGSVTASVNGEDAAPLGETGTEVNKTLVAP